MSPTKKTILYTWIRYIITFLGMIFSLIIAHGQMFKSDIKEIHESLERIATKLEEHANDKTIHSSPESMGLLKDWLQTEIQYVREDIKELRKDIRHKER